MMTKRKLNVRAGFENAWSWLVDGVLGTVVGWLDDGMNALFDAPKKIKAWWLSLERREVLRREGRKYQLEVWYVHVGTESANSFSFRVYDNAPNLTYSDLTRDEAEELGQQIGVYGKDHGYRVRTTERMMRGR